MTHNTSTRQKYFSPKAQAMVEFAIALPFLLLIIYGIFEISRLAFMFTSVANASRAAARYASGSGENSEGIPHYIDCDGIRAVANQSAYITDFTDINITYDRGVNTEGEQIPISGVDPLASKNTCPIENINLHNGDRVIVQVSAYYKPVVSIVPINPIEIASSNARTFIVSIPIFGSSVPLGFSPETSTPSRMAANNTPTATFTPFSTPTRVAIDLTKYAYELTNAPPPSLTFTPSNTPLPTNTPTVVPTRISCGVGNTGIGNSGITYKDNVLQMELYNNTGYPINVAEVYIAWNHDKGHQGDDPFLRLRSVFLDYQVWNGDILAPSQFIKDYRPAIPVGTSVIKFSFNQNYDILDDTERVVISLLTPGCEGYLIDSGR